MAEKAFGYVEHAWKEYKTLAGVTTAVKQHLASCLGEEVLTLLYAKFGAEGYDALTEDGLMEAAKGEVEEQVGDRAAVEEDIAGP